jgi:hypothetical protein
VRLLATARGLPYGAAPVTLTTEVREGGRVVARRSTGLTLVVPEER